MKIIDDIRFQIQEGDLEEVQNLVMKALQEGVAPKMILDDGLLEAMSIIGVQFKNNELFMPEVLMSAKAMGAGVEALKPYLVQSDMEDKGTAIIGTIKGDLHDIGKNLVKMMIEGQGIKVIDLGVDIEPKTFVEEAIACNAKIICCSALLTTTMNTMYELVEEVQKAGIRDSVKIMIGGAPVTQEFCDKIKADCYTRDAGSAAEAALKLCKGAI